MSLMKGIRANSSDFLTYYTYHQPIFLKLRQICTKLLEPLLIIHGECRTSDKHVLENYCSYFSTKT